MVRQEDLNAHSHMYVEMIRCSNWFRGSAADRRSNASTLRVREAGAGSAAAAFQKQGCALCGDGRVDTVNVIEGLAGRQRSISFARGLQTSLESNAKTLV